MVAVYNALKDKGVDQPQIHSNILNIKREKREKTKRDSHFLLLFVTVTFCF